MVLSYGNRILAALFVILAISLNDEKAEWPKGLFGAHLGTLDVEQLGLCPIWVQRAAPDMAFRYLKVDLFAIRDRLVAAQISLQRFDQGRTCSKSFRAFCKQTIELHRIIYDGSSFRDFSISDDRDVLSSLLT